jgi:hypothetical protein
VFFSRLSYNGTSELCYIAQWFIRITSTNNNVHKKGQNTNHVSAQQNKKEKMSVGIGAEAVNGNPNKNISVFPTTKNQTNQRPLMRLGLFANFRAYRSFYESQNPH